MSRSIALTAISSVVRDSSSALLMQGARRANPISSIRSLDRFYQSFPARPISPVTLQPTTHRFSIRHQSTSSSSSTSTRPCPSCSAPIPHTSTPCPKCSTLIPLPSGLSHHSLLSVSQPIPASSTSKSYDIPAELSGLPASGFDLQPRELRQRMLGRQRELHPDKYGSAGEGVVVLARELSGRINMAYETLADPLRRAEYILSVHDLPMEETDSLTDPMLLAEIMEAREELEEAQNQEDVENLRIANHEKVQGTISALTEAFSARPPDMKAAKDLAVQLRYWRGLEEAAKEWAPGKGAGASAGSGFTHS